MLKYHKVIISFLFFWLVLQLSYSLGAYVDHRANIDKSVSQIQTRIALDLPRLSLPDRSLNNVGDHSSIINYIKKFNTQLNKMGYKAQLHTIQNISIDNKNNDSLIYRSLLALGESVNIQISEPSFVISEYLSLIPLLIAILFAYLTLDHILIWQNRKNTLLITQDEPKTPFLIINLKEKVLINSETNVTIPLANKPLCFYVALTEFCTLNKDIVLNQNKDLPDELTELANKYFLRLIELGHTVRKRPNFSNSLEKTLSEIRAALDEVFTDTPELKAIYYPPKAHGEGSRSKLHHYGLSTIETEHIELIGK